MEIKKLRLYVSDIAVDVFYDRAMNFENNQQAVVILSGFPDFIGASAMTNYQVSIGNIVFQPHMRGTFDSDGSFSPAGVKESLKALNKLITESSGSNVPNGEVEDFPWKIDSVILIGHSFGGLLVLRYFTEILNVKSIIFTSPALHYGPQYGCKEIGPEHYREVGEKYPFTYRLSPVSDWEEILQGTEKIPEYPLGSVKKVVIIYGEKDKYFDMGLVKRTAIDLIKTYIEADDYLFLIAEKAGHPVAELLSNNEITRLLEEVCRK